MKANFKAFCEHPSPRPQPTSPVEAPPSQTLPPAPKDTTEEALGTKPEDTKVLTRLQKLRTFMEVEGLTSFDKEKIAFKDHLMKRDIEKIVITGFKNGAEGRVKIPESVLGDARNSQVVMVKCCEQGFPMMTKKFVMARGRGLMAVSSKYLVRWAETAAIPTLEKYPVKCEWSHRYGHSVFMTPLKETIFRGQFFCFLNTEGWMIKPINLGFIIGRLGGKVVFAGKCGTLASGVTCYNLSRVPVRGEEVDDPACVGNMVVAGRWLSREKWLVGDGREEDDLMPCSQVCRLTRSDFWIVSCLFIHPDHLPIQAVCTVKMPKKKPVLTRGRLTKSKQEDVIDTTAETHKPPIPSLGNNPHLGLSSSSAAKLSFGGTLGALVNPFLAQSFLANPFLAQNTFSEPLAQNTFSNLLAQNTFSNLLAQNTFSNHLAQSTFGNPFSNPFMAQGLIGVQQPSVLSILQVVSQPLAQLSNFSPPRPPSSSSRPPWPSSS